MRSFIACFALLVAFLSPAAHAWWNADWAARKAVTLTAPAGEATDAPVLIRLHTGNFDFLAAKPDGSDLRVLADDDKTELPVFIEKWDDLNQLALVWVKVPKLAAKTSLWLYFGNEAATPVSSSKTSVDATTASYAFAEANGNPVDGGAGGRNATAFTGSRVAASFANGGVKFAAGQSLAVPLSASGNAATLAFWIKPEALDGALLAAEGFSATLAGGVLTVQAGAASLTAATPLVAGQWQHVALVFADTLTLYLDGKPVGSARGATAPAGTLTVGGGYAGELDALQIATTARDAAWIAVAAAAGQGSTLVALGADESGEGGGEHAGIWGTLFKALTLDGWVAIGVLAVMLVLAIWIMIVKALYVNKVDAANRKFMVKFRALSTDLGAIDHDVADKAQGIANDFRAASLYRIYHVAATELAHRFKDTDAAHLKDKNLSSQSLEAIRASLDTQLIKETGRMNSLMVLLTIAISGGPFIGLLGTVLGVMITFAVIAATGDVNVASIAPGIAAALMATAAGMAVAIPSLFGYNYLNARIKAITTDMRVFNDELITKLAENYSK